jgi:hypothetical protein
MLGDLLRPKRTGGPVNPTVHRCARMPSVSYDQWNTRASSPKKGMTMSEIDRELLKLSQVLMGDEPNEEKLAEAAATAIFLLGGFLKDVRRIADAAEAVPRAEPIRQADKRVVAPDEFPTEPR